MNRTSGHRGFLSCIQTRTVTVKAGHLKSRMCSVVGCYSGHLGVQRFKLPEDPERRLEWVRFLATANKQRFKESSWTDISVCVEHFKEDCFETESGVTDKVHFTLKPSAVPSLFDKSECEEPEPSSLESPTCGESLETIEGQRDHVKSCDSSSSSSEGSGINLIAFQVNPVPRKASSSPDKPQVMIPGQMQPRNVNNNLMREKAARLQMKGKFVVNEKHLLRLLNPKCPSCDCKLKIEKVTSGLLIIFNQQCLQCGYRNQWTSQVNANIPTDEEQHLTGHVEVTPESQQVEPTDDAQRGMTDVPEIVASIDEESDQMEETDESDQDDMDSDEDWKPDKNSLLAKVPPPKTRGEDETEDDDEDDDEEEEEDDLPPIAHRDSQLCTDCGKFFNKCRPHTCEHKTKPYSCNICGKRFAFDHALSRHSRIHDANYEYRCKYCHVTFKTKVDKITHEQTHMIEGKPYKCPDCPETFAKNKERRIHIQDHRGPPQLKCDFCGIEFCWPLALRRHLAVHTGEKPYKCTVCERGFNQQSHLKSHMRLHTGERPFKCQHCDKCFNHNVSLKSHVQRYHTFDLGEEPGNNNETSRTAFDVRGDQNNRVAASAPSNVEVKQEPEESVGVEQISRPKYKKRSTGRPLGRPKSDEPNTKTPKRLQSSKKKQCTEESDDEQSDRDMSSDSAEEEEKRNKKMKQNISRSRGRVKRSNGKKKYSCQNTGKSLKRRGRPRKNHELCS